jgi:hypothetical protein
MDFNADAARKAGHSEEDIARIQNQINSARQAGYSDAQIQAELAKETANQASGDYTIPGAAKALARSAGEGVASILDVPAQAATLIRNTPALSTNAAIEAAKHATPEQLRERGVNPDVANMQPEALAKSADTNTKAYREIFGQPDPAHPWINAVGETAGPAIVEALATGGLSVPASVGSVVRATTRGAGRVAATTAGTVVGGETGKYAGKYAGRGIDYLTGGENAESLLEGYGQLIGGGLGGGVGPSIVERIPEHYANWKYTDENSKTLNALADMIGMRNKSLGLVGTKRAGQVEDFTTTVPFAGDRVFEARRSQYEDFDRVAREIHDAQGGSAGDINTATMGSQARDLGQKADEIAAQKQEAAFGPMKARVGPNTVADPAPIRQKLQNQIAGATTGVDEAAPAYLLHLVDENRLKPLPGNVPKVHDPATETVLQNNLVRAKSVLASALPDSPLAKAAQTSLQQIQQAILDNRGPTFENLIKLRRVTANRLDPAKDFEKSSLIESKGVLTDAQRETAASRGVTAQEFDAANAEYGRLAEQRSNFFKPMAEKTGEGEAYNTLFSGTQEANASKLNALSEHVPIALQRLMADKFEQELRGAAAGSPGVSAETVKPGGKLAWWHDLPEEARTLMAGQPGSPSRTKASALVTLLEADTRRPGRAKPGSGSNTLSGGLAIPQAVRSITAPLLAGAVLGNVPGAALGAAGGAVHAFAPSLIYNYLGRKFTDPNFVDRAVNPRAWADLNPKTLARIMAASVASENLP